MSKSLVKRAEEHDYQNLFLEDLGWSKPTHRDPISLTTETGDEVTARNISSYKGVTVWVCDQQPGSALEAELDKLIAKQSTDRLTIFHSADEQVWRWPVRQAKDNGLSIRLSRHHHHTGQEDPNFAHRLEKIRIDWEQPLDASGLVAQIREAFDVEAQNETRHASKIMARMYGALEACGTSQHVISVVLARTLFLMFGDDTEMWRANLFHHFIATRTKPNGSDLAERLNELFIWLNTPDKQRVSVPEHLDGFKYVNGGIFSEEIELPALSAEFRKVVLEASARDWATISPAIFGSMFQSVRDAQTRRELGEHYTSEENILKTLNPLFLDELRADFEAAKKMTNEKLALRRLRDRLGEIKFIDPACGCGNFIIIAYRELRDLELRIMERLQELTGESPSLMANYGLKVSLDNFYGIEIDEWPAKIAETAMFLIDRQCDLKLTERLGWAPDRLPIKRQATIVVGNALRLDWEKICPANDNSIVAGNPPFIGQYTKTEQQVEDAKSVWGKDYDGYLDYVTSWHSKTLQYLRGTKALWAFVTTNSITQGQAVAALFRPVFRDGWRIKFAHRTFPWTSEAAGKAAVHCVIIGFTNDKAAKPRLFEYGSNVSAAREVAVANINAYLLDAGDLLVEKRMKPLAPGLPGVRLGSKPADGGYLQIKESDIGRALDDSIAGKYVRPFVGADELLSNKKRWCLWLVGATSDEIAASEFLRERVTAVRDMRLRSTKASTRAAAETAHLFTELRQPNVGYLGIPAHFSENRDYFTVAWFPSETIAGNANFTAEDPDGFLFAVISSSMFIIWQRMIGGRIKSDPRFSNTVVWNNFPLPIVSLELREEIIGAGRDVMTARDLEPGKSLADQYAPGVLAPALAAAHDALDLLVAKAFGAKPGQSEQEYQRVLFRSYQDLTADLLTLAAPKNVRSRK